MTIQTLRTKTARTIAAGSLALSQGRHREASECADGALVGLIALSAQGAAALDLVERVDRLENRINGQG